MPAKSRTFTIRRAAEKDAEGILVCLHAAFEPYKLRYTRGAYEDTTLTPATIHQRLAEATVLVAVDATGEIVGTIGYQLLQKGEGHLRGMAVLPGWQGSTVAWELLMAAEAGLRRDGCLRVNLDTTEPLRRAVCFYEKNGFRATGRVTDFFGMPIFEYVKNLI